MPGVTISNNVIVGIRSIVTKDIKSNSVVVGIPAKKIKTVDEYHEKIKKKSLKIGHLSREKKEKKLKEIFQKWAKMKSLIIWKHLIIIIII